MESFVKAFQDEGSETLLLLRMQEDDLKEAFKECGVKRMGDRFKLTERLRVLKSVMTKHLEPESLESQEEYQNESQEKSQKASQESQKRIPRTITRRIPRTSRKISRISRKS